MKTLATLRTPQSVRNRMGRMVYAMGILEDGLDDCKHILHETDGESVQALLHALGIVLVSKSAVQRRGHVLKRGAKPVMSRYFGAPIQKYVELYILDVQTKPDPRKARSS